MNKEYFFNIKSPTAIVPSLNSFLILEAAIKKGIKCKYIQGTDYFELSSGKKIQTLRIDHNSLGFDYHAWKILQDKGQTKAFLDKAGLYTPAGVRISRGKKFYPQAVIEQLGVPLVIKPAVDTFGGDGVKTNINTSRILTDSIQELFKLGFGDLLIEEQFPAANEYRITATRKKVCGVTRRIPANVVGDGRRTIQELIIEKNNDPRRGGHDYQNPLIKIEVDDQVVAYLAKQNLTLDSIPKSDEQVFLRQNSNLSTGGDSINCTDIIHPSVADIAVRAVQSIPGLPYAGIDLMTDDISKEQVAESYCILEMNAAPMVSMHHSPYAGKPRNVADDIIDVVFFNDK